MEEHASSDNAFTGVIRRTGLGLPPESVRVASDEGVPAHLSERSWWGLRGKD